VGGDAVVEDLVAHLVEAVFETVVQDLAEMVYKVVEDFVAVVVDDDVADDSERGAGTAGGGTVAPSGGGAGGKASLRRARPPQDRVRPVGWCGRRTLARDPSVCVSLRPPRDTPAGPPCPPPSRWRSGLSPSAAL